MTNLSGKKIFVLYPDSFLREKVFHGSLRNQFQIYYIFDYEKIRLLADYYPGCIICINLVNNDLDWLVDDIIEGLEGISEENYPKIALLTDREPPSAAASCPLVDFRKNPEEIIEDIKKLFSDFGGRGRRNFVRYGGYGESVATIRVRTDGDFATGTVHDISASGLSCSFQENIELNASSGDIEIRLDLAGTGLTLKATKILERAMDGRLIHILQFERNMSEDKLDELSRFIHSSLDARMEEFINKLSKQ